MRFKSRACASATLAVLGLLAGCTVEPPKPVIDLPPNPPPGSPSTPKLPDGASAKNEGPGAEAGPPPMLAAPKGPNKVDMDSMIGRAVRALDTGNLPGAQRVLEEAIAAEPTNRRALSMLVMVTQNLALQLKRPANTPLYLKSAETFRKIRALKVELTPDERRNGPTVLYNEACTLAMIGEPDRAIKSFEEAVDAGFEMADHVDQDQELDPLRKLPKFQELQHKLELKVVTSRIAAQKPWRFDFRLKDLDGKPTAFDDVKGALTIVDFWGTWCVPCRKEIPHLVELSKKYREKGLKVVGLNYEEDEGETSRQAVREFIKSYAIPYTCLLGDGAAKSLVPKFEGYPTTLFVDPKGDVKLQLTGYQSLDAIETAVTTLLGLNPPAKEKETPKAKIDGPSEPTEPPKK